MSRAVSELPANGADAPELPPPSRPGWLHRQRHLIGLGLSLLLFGLALLACWHLVREINPDQVRDSLAAVPPRALFAAMLATVLGFLLMLAYEWSASRYADVRLPASTLALGASAPSPSATLWACRRCPGARCAIACTRAMGSARAMWRE